MEPFQWTNCSKLWQMVFLLCLYLSFCFIGTGFNFHTGHALNQPFPQPTSYRHLDSFQS